MPFRLHIRFSSRRQKDGTSIRRQIDYGRAFCRRESISFDPDSQTLCDEGTSGFRGKHRQEGRSGGLSEFLARCESGKVTPGSYLLVESLDRRTREHPLDAMDLLRKLLREYGVVLVVMRPEMKLTSQSLGQLEGIIAFLEAMRAHGESARKSDMSRYNWEIKRAEASTKPVTARVPSWLTVEDGEIVPVKEKVKAVHRHQESSVNDAEAKGLIGKLLDGYTPGSVLHLLGDVLHANAGAAERDGDPERAERLREAGTTLYVVGAGIDAVAGE